MTDSDDRSVAERICRLAPELQERILAGTSDGEREDLAFHWPLFERPRQSEPELPWRTWLVMSGRGYGKTRMGAEWVRRTAAEHPTACIALVGATREQARAWMIENDNGILGVCAPDERPEWEPSLWRLRWPNGARAFVYSAAEPDSLRGPQHHFAWCDEIAKWPLGMEAWSNLMFGLRRGALPRVMATTTPRPVPLVRALMAQGVALTRGRTIENASNLPGFFIGEVTRDYGGGRLGRQELDGELIDDVEGSLWPRDLIEKCRAAGPPPSGFRRVVVGVDPPVSAGGTCGIVVCALGGDGSAYVLADASVAGVRPEGWALRVEAAASAWGADRVVAEGNQGGAMVEAVLRGANVVLPMRIEHAFDGKSARAEPVAALFESGRAKFAGGFPELEDQLAGMIAGGDYEGPGRSPDRADAMVWAMTALMLRKRRAEPRIRLL
ncbi:MAG TPA: terminase family protein [Allosphingosinicella sp.]|jgi:phage terminase large subunit-like protein